MTIVHIEKISTGLWTIFANFKTELKQVTIFLHLSKILQFYCTNKNKTKSAHVLMIYATVMSMKM